MQSPEKRKAIWLVAGNKGGVGKSLMSMLLASSLELRQESFAVIDGDGRTNDIYKTFLRKAPAVSLDFRKLQPTSPLDPLDADYESHVTQLINSSDNLIINTPDGADDILMKWFDVTLVHCKPANAVFKLIYMMSDRVEGTPIIDTMMDKFPLMYPVKNLYFGKESDFYHYDIEYARNFRQTLVLPKLRQDEVRFLFKNKIYPTEAIRLKLDNGKFMVPALSRRRIMDWILDFFMPVESELFDNTTKPNLVMKS